MQIDNQERKRLHWLLAMLSLSQICKSDRRLHPVLLPVFPRLSFQRQRGWDRCLVWFLAFIPHREIFFWMRCRCQSFGSRGALQPLWEQVESLLAPRTTRVRLSLSVLQGSWCQKGLRWGKRYEQQPCEHTWRRIVLQMWREPMLKQGKTWRRWCCRELWSD